MPTPHDAPYKVEQREAKASKRRVYPRWISCHIFYYGLSLIKVPAQGTYRCRAKQNRPRGKSAVKAAKRATHSKRYYLLDRPKPDFAQYLEPQCDDVMRTILAEDPNAVVSKVVYQGA